MWSWSCSKQWVSQVLQSASWLTQVFQTFVFPCCCLGAGLMTMGYSQVSQCLARYWIRMPEQKKTTRKHTVSIQLQPSWMSHWALELFWATGARHKHGRLINWLEWLHTLIMYTPCVGPPLPVTGCCLTACREPRLLWGQWSEAEFCIRTHGHLYLHTM